MTIRVLTITSWYPPHHYGGYELSCYDVNTRFAARGHDVRVLCGDERMPTAAAADGEHERHVFRELRAHWREGSDWRPSLRETVAIERHNRRVLEHHLDEFRPQVVAMWHMVAISAALLRYCSDRGIPVVDVVCDEWPVYMEKFDPWTSRFAGNPARNWAGRIVEMATRLRTTAGDFTDTGVFCFVSEATRWRALDDRPWSFPMSTVVFSGIERALFPMVADAGRAPWAWRVLYVGRLDATKGVETLLRGFAELPEPATLACYGRGADQERARLRSIAEKLGIDQRVTFGSLERDELAATYSAADVVVFPSEWPEPFGLVPLEAMACGTPVVATGVGGSAEFLRDGYNCVLFAAGDAPALAAAVRRVHDDPALRATIVTGGAATAEQLDVDALTDALEQWHVAAASGFRDGRPRDRTLALPRAPSAITRNAGDHMPSATYLREDAPAIAVYTHQAGSAAPHTCKVIARPESLPFRAQAFDTTYAVALLERATDDRAAAGELTRVMRSGGTVVLEAPNRDDLLLRWKRFRDWSAGRRIPPHAYVHAAAHRREYTVVEMGTRLAGFTITRAPRPIPWGNGPKRRAATSIVRALRLRRGAQAFVIEAQRT